MYVSEAGGGLDVKQLAPSRILRVEGGRATEVANLTSQGVHAALIGMTWHDGAFYITHRAQDLTGAVSRVTMDGRATQLFSGIIDNQDEHQANDVRMGPDGRMYVAVGQAGNSAVVGPDIAPWVKASPTLHPRPCKDIVLTGRNYKSPDFRTEQMGDSVVTGAFVTFGTTTTPGQRIAGVTKCGGSILVFDPNNAEATLRVHAWGIRQPIGMAWNRTTGEMFVGENGYDIRGLRPVNDEYDATLRVREGAWLGFPDFSAAREPLTLAKFESPDSLQPMVIVNGQPQGKGLDFIIDHAASGLTPPDRSVVVGLHPFNSSPSKLDVAPASWGEWAGHVFVAEFGDLAPGTNPLRSQPAGYRVVRIDPATNQVEPFIRNRQAGPASEQGAKGRGIERPFDPKFGPDGALYLVDYGVFKLDKSQTPPFRSEPGTGTIWRVTRTEMQTPGQQMQRDGTAGQMQQQPAQRKRMRVRKDPS